MSGGMMSHHLGGANRRNPCRSADQLLLEQYLRSVRDDPRLAEAGKHYVALEVRVEPDGAPTDALEALEGTNRAVIQGCLGAGKTTLLCRLAHKCAEDALSSGREAPIPFLLDLALLRESEGMTGLLLRALRRYQPAVRDETLRAILERQTPLLLFDNLDRITDSRLLVELKSWLVRYTQECPSARVVIACRTHSLPAHRSWLGRFSTLTVLGLSDGSIGEFVHRLGAEDRATVNLGLTRDAGLWDLAHIPLFLKAILNLAGALGARGPWWSRCCVIKESIRIARGLAEGGQVKQWLEDEGQGLAELAFALQQAGSDSASEERGAEIMAGAGQRIDDALCSGLLVLTADGRRVNFLHALVQEFFTAVALERRLKDGLDLDHLVQGQDTQQRWEGPLIQLYGLVSDRLGLIRRLLAGQPDHARVRLAARCLVGNEGRPALQERVRQILTLHFPQSTLYHLGIALKELRATEEAAVVLNQALTEWPAGGPVPSSKRLAPSTVLSAEGWLPEGVIHHYNLGVIHRELGRGGEAAVELQRALRETDRLCAGILCELGLTFQRQGRYEDALEAFQQALSRQPETAICLYQAGVTLNRLGRYREARERLEQALAQGPERAEIWREIGYCYRRQRWYAEALRALEQAIRLAPADGSLYREVGLVFAKQEKHAQAIGYLQQALALQPDQALWHDELGVLYEAAERWEEACREYKLAVMLEPTNAVYHHHLGSAYHRMGESGEAVQSLRRAVELSPDRAEARADLARSLDAQGNHLEALSEYRIAVVLGLRKADYHYGIGCSLYHLKKYDEALAE
ncbi:MAG TPA: tetratricopeptide repeat protein, partial [Chloroflexi bacterium]|nr:tetratricopeptide repeat protein [Chloroflexota bacterium]